MKLTKVDREYGRALLYLDGLTPSFPTEAAYLLFLLSCQQHRSSPRDHEMLAMDRTSLSPILCSYGSWSFCFPLSPPSSEVICMLSSHQVVWRSKSEGFNPVKWTNCLLRSYNTEFFWSLHILVALLALLGMHISVSYSATL